MGLGLPKNLKHDFELSPSGSVFEVVFWSAFCGILAPFGCHLGAFWETFSDFFEVCGVLLDCTHSRAKTYFMRFGRSLVSPCSSTFAGADSRVCF